MTDHDNIGPNLPQSLHDLLVGQAISGSVDEIDLKTMIEERPCQHQQPKWRLITECAIGDHRLQRGVNESDLHYTLFRSVVCRQCC